MSALRESYSFTELKKIDWGAMEARYARRARNASSNEQFVAAIEPMLAQLRDLHVWISSPANERHQPFHSSFDPNYDFRVVESQLSTIERIKGIGFTGRTNTGIGVAVIISLPANGEYDGFLAAMKRIEDTSGMIVDLRRNSGGSEANAARLAAFFTNRRTKYARNQRRVGGELRETESRYLNPSLRGAYTRPVVCLIGPGCVSSGEGFALMMKSLDHVTMIGQPTRGASGNPQPVTLSNGVQVWFSRWVSLELDGTPIEGRGVQPDEYVEHSANSDATFQRATEILEHQKAAR